jgi:hypothetical protein
LYRLGETLNLGFRSFVIDPKLISYNVSALLSHQSGDGTGSSTLEGLGLNATLFRSLPKGLNGSSIYIPHPLWLRINRLVGTDTDYTAYGFSFMHSVPREKLLVVTEVKEEEREKDADLYEEGPSRTVKTAEKRTAPFPVTFFDYDHYDYKSGGAPSATDLYSLRSTLTGDVSNYQLLFQHENQTGIADFKRTRAELRPDYRFYDENTKRLLDIRNLLSYQTTDTARDAAVSSGLTWSRPIGKDSLSLTGQLSAAGSSGERETAKEYVASASGSYTKYISPRWTNGTSLSAGFTKSDRSSGNAPADPAGPSPSASSATNDPSLRHFESLSDTLSVVLSRIFNGSAGAFLGESGAGPSYGANLFLRMNTRINASLGYSFASTSSQATTDSTLQTSSRRTSGHRLSLNAGGPLLSNLRFLTVANYSLTDVSDAEDPRKEKTLFTSAALYWSFPKTSVTFGGMYTSTQREENGGTTSGASTSFIATVQRYLTRRMFFNLYSAWMRDNTGRTRLDIQPQLTWTRGSTSIDLKYGYGRTAGADMTTTSDHRIFAGLVRSFSVIR